MVEMLTRQLVDNRLLRQTAGPDLSVSLGSALGEIASQDMMTGLIGSQAEIFGAGFGAFTDDQRTQFRIDEMDNARRANELRFELQQDVGLTDFERDEIATEIETLQSARGAGGALYDSAVQESIDAGRMQTAEELNAQYEEIGLVFDRPTTPEEAKLLADGKKEEIIRNAIIGRAPQGVLPGIAKFGAGLAAMATDPLEIASMFIPVVGQAGKLAAVGRLGRIGGRVAIGATEGLVGAALTEPFYYGLSRQQQLDYTMADALLNIGLGAVFGGGLGGIAGTIGKVRGTVDPLARVDTPRVDGEAPRIDAEIGKIDAEVSKVDAGRAAQVSHSTLQPARIAVTPIDKQAAETALRQFVLDQDINVAPIVDEYRMEHTSPTREGGDAPANDLTAIYPDDVYGLRGVDYYGTGNKSMDRKTLNILRDLRGKPDAEITMYRAVPNDVTVINAGDWVTPNRDYAVDHGEGPLGGDYHVIEKTVRADEVYTNGDSMHEFGYDPIAKKAPTPVGYSGASELAKHAQQPSRHADQEASQAFDELAKKETTTEAALREEVDMLESMVEQLALANQPTPKFSMRGPKRPQTLSEFLRAAGGINDADPTFRGELKHAGINPAIRNNGLSNPTSKFNLDDMAELAEQHGFIDERDPNALVELLRAETAGEFTFSRDDAAQAGDWRDFHDAKAEARDMLDGLTPEQRASLEEIAAIETKAKAYANLAEVAATCMART